jgi:hypothetical protein
LSRSQLARSVGASKETPRHPKENTTSPCRCPPVTLMRGAFALAEATHTLLVAAATLPAVSRHPKENTTSPCRCPPVTLMRGAFAFTPVTLTPSYGALGFCHLGHPRARISHDLIFPSLQRLAPGFTDRRLAGASVRRLPAPRATKLGRRTTRYEGSAAYGAGDNHVAVFVIQNCIAAVTGFGAGPTMADPRARSL